MSEIRANTISDAAGTGPVTLTGQYAAKAWVNFNGDTGAIRESGNVSSITDNGTGDYTVNFTTALTDANYSFCSSAGNNSTANRIISPGVVNAPTTTSHRFIVVQSTFTAADAPFVAFAAFR